MKKLIHFFRPVEQISFFDELKTGFFIRICLIGVFLITGLLISDFIFVSANFLISALSRVVMILFFMVSLLVLKYKGIRFVGNFFSIGITLSLVTFINMVSNEIDVTYKFIQGFYTVFGCVIICGLFAIRPVILTNTLLLLLSTTRVYLFMLNNQADKSELLTSAYIQHTIVLVSITIIVYFTSRFVELTINKGSEEIAMRESQNNELLTSEEEIRATNEELVATTDALIETNEELTDAIQKAAESDRLKSEFLNNMSHEVRTPMNGIIGFSQLLDIPDLSEKSRKNYIHTIQQSSHQLLSIIDNIIEISKLGTKQVKVVEQRVDLNSKLKELYNVFEIELKNKPVSFTLITALPDRDCFLYVDEIKLYKILSNLLENALRFTGKGSIEFGYTILKDHNLDYKGAAVQFFVKDTGIGILPEKQETIFNRFSQADSDLSRQFGGLGLGLSIAKENTELLQGRISLESERRIGSTFFITIPYKPVLPS